MKSSAHEAGCSVPNSRHSVPNGFNAQRGAKADHDVGAVPSVASERPPLISDAQYNSNANRTSASGLPSDTQCAKLVPTALQATPERKHKCNHGRANMSAYDASAEACLQASPRSTPQCSSGNPAWAPAASSALAQTESPGCGTTQYPCAASSPQRPQPSAPADVQRASGADGKNPGEQPAPEAGTLLSKVLTSWATSPPSSDTSLQARRTPLSFKHRSGKQASVSTSDPAVAPSKKAASSQKCATQSAAAQSASEGVPPPSPVSVFGPDTPAAALCSHAANSQPSAMTAAHAHVQPAAQLPTTSPASPAGGAQSTAALPWSETDASKRTSAPVATPDVDWPSPFKPPVVVTRKRSSAPRKRTKASGGGADSASVLAHLLPAEHDSDLTIRPDPAEHAEFPARPAADTAVANTQRSLQQAKQQHRAQAELARIDAQLCASVAPQTLPLFKTLPSVSLFEGQPPHTAPLRPLLATNAAAFVALWQR